MRPRKIGEKPALAFPQQPETAVEQVKGQAVGRDDDDDDDDDEYEELEQVLFQGPMFGLETNLKQNPRLVKAALVPVKKMISDGLSRRAHTILLEPAQGCVAIRFVVDGIPYPAGVLPGQRGMAMIQMVKVLAG